MCDSMEYKTPQTIRTKKWFDLNKFNKVTVNQPIYLIKQNKHTKCFYTGVAFMEILKNVKKNSCLNLTVPYSDVLWYPKKCIPQCMFYQKLNEIVYENKNHFKRHKYASSEVLISNIYQPPPRRMGEALVVTKPVPYQLIRKRYTQKLSECDTGRSSLTA